jgi:hypothetical protein
VFGKEEIDSELRFIIKEVTGGKSLCLGMYKSSTEDLIWQLGNDYRA